MGKPRDRTHDLLLRFSGARMKTYYHLTGGKTKDVLALYKWNVALSAAFLELLAIIEVAVRNALYEQLSEWCRARGCDPSWLKSHEDMPKELQKLFGAVRSGAVSYAAEAKELRDSVGIHYRAGAELTDGDILAQISFGKWHNLIPYVEGQLKDPSTNSYRTNLWEHSLHRAFRRGASSDEVRWLLYRLSYFRNRVAHHEFIIGDSLKYSRRSPNPLQQRLSDILKLAALIDEDLVELLTGMNRVTELLKNCPIVIR